jgi:uncharacterized protein (DUF2164 family)
MATPVDDHSHTRDMSWVGDAVLALCAREWIIANESRLEGPRHLLLKDLTSNQFLACFGNPTEIEAELGVVYTHQGLAAAQAYFESKLVPIFERQHRNRRKN